MRRLPYIAALWMVSVSAFAQDEAAPPPPPPADPAAAPTLEDIRQVQIQVWISETNESGLRDIGTNLNYTRFVDGVEQNGSVQQIASRVFSPLDDFDPLTLPAPSSNPESPPFEPLQSNPAFAAPVRPDLSGNIGDGIQTRGGFGLTATVVDADSGTIDAVFRGIERKADSDLVSKPELLVINGEAAKIQAGQEFPYQSVEYNAKGVPQLSIAWRDLGVNLDLTPTILPNNLVKLSITQLEVSELSRIDNIRGVELPVFSKRSQNGVVMVPGGRTLVIGGLSSRTVRKTERRVPVVGRIPVLGFPFRSRRSEADITTLLVFVSPTVVNLRNLTKPAQSALDFWRDRGDDWAHADQIEREIDSMEDDL